MYSSFSTATPRVVCSAAMDELLLLWCMLEPESRYKLNKTFHFEFDNTAKQKYLGAFLSSKEYSKSL